MITTKGKDPVFEEHLQWVCELELWTIPLYLSAAYSIKPLSEQANNKTLAATVQKQLLSVAVQEMYHLQLACNLATTFGLKPRLENPTYGSLPHIHPDKSIDVEIGNLYETIDLMIEVETPDSHCPPRVPPTPNKKGEILYDSIGDIYNVLTQMVIKNWDNPYYAKKRAAYLKKQKTETTFKNRYPQVSIITDLGSALDTIRVIVEQGEGSQISSCPHADPRQPISGSDQPTATSRFYDFDDHSHYERFVDIKSKIYSLDKKKLIEVYDNIGRPTNKAADIQSGLDGSYTFFLLSMRDAWSIVEGPKKDGSQPIQPQNLDSSFFTPMYFLRELITQIWQNNAVPAFNEVTKAAAKKQYKNALKNYDTNDIYRQSREDHAVPNYYQHACQGLNGCEGLGHNGSGTKAGNGACATAVPHSCSGSNSCQGQGGCAYQNNPSLNVPFKNAKKASNKGIPQKGQGGCQIPISPRQVFSGSSVVAIQDLKIGKKTYKKGASIDGVSVWEYARALFAARNSLDSLPAVETTERRKEVAPTSPAY